MAPLPSITVDEPSDSPDKEKLPPRPNLSVCFSFAAYAKKLIQHLRTTLDISVLPGLSDGEISAVEISHNFSFPPDIRSILQVGLPVGIHFPDWRTPPPCLRILFNLPILALSKNVMRNRFWVGSWGGRPVDDDHAVALVTKLVAEAPMLIPLYGRYYVPSSPSLAGNPVFWVDENGVKVVSFDVAAFFSRFGIVLASGLNYVSLEEETCGAVSAGKAPPWAATAPRRIHFWTEAAENSAKATERPWWSSITDGGLRLCLDDVLRRLRQGGWREEDIRDMMLFCRPVGGHCHETRDSAKKLTRSCSYEPEDRRNPRSANTLMHLLSLEV